MTEKMTKVMIGKRASCIDFKPLEVLTALERIKKLSQEATGDDSDSQGQLAASASSIMTAVEGLMTVSVADESEYSACWLKLLRYVVDKKKLPEYLKEIDIEVAKQFAYLLNAQITESGISAADVKAELSETGTNRDILGGDTMSAAGNGSAQGRSHFKAYVEFGFHHIPCKPYSVFHECCSYELWQLWLWQLCMCTC